MEARLIINVIDSLDSTSATDALSANQGRVLNEKVEEVRDSIPVVEDSGWNDLELLNGAIPFSNEQRPRYRKIGNQVFIKGVYKGLAQTGVTIGSLPAGFRPATKVIYVQSGTAYRIDRVDIDTNGDIFYGASTSAPEVNSWHSLHTSFLID